MNVLSLFTGVGGIDLGLERAGFRIAAQCEADPAARRILERHWPGVPLSADVRTLDAEWLESNGLHPEPARRDQGARSSGSLGRRAGNEADHLPLDLVCGGFPCQDLSVAGRRAGLAGDRSGLFFEATRISDLVLGAGGWLLIENVPGLFSSNAGRDFGIVLSTLADLGFHDLAWRVLDSRYFGVPQRRRRVFILARRARGDRAKQVLLEPESGGGNFTPSSEARPGSPEPSSVSTLTSGGKGRRGYRIGAEAAAGGQLISPAVTSKWKKGTGRPAGDECQNLVTHTLTSEGHDASEDGTGRGTPIVGAFMAGQGAKAGGIGYDEGVSPTLKSAGSGTNQAPTIHGQGVRRLTPTECERLQGFPDGWTIPDETDWREYPKPDGPRYAQMGNAVTVNVAEWIGARLMEVESAIGGPTE